MRNRKGMETRKHQREATNHFHPRGLARAVVHHRMANADMYGVNKVKPGAAQSAFAVNWRRDAERIAR